MIRKLTDKQILENIVRDFSLFQADLEEIKENLFRLENKVTDLKTKVRVIEIDILYG